MKRRLAAVISVAIYVAAIAPTTILAAEGESGTVGCADTRLGYVRFYYNDMASVKAPGLTQSYAYTDNDNTWHLRERNGADGGGLWTVVGDPFLNVNQTSAGCRSYG